MAQKKETEAVIKLNLHDTLQMLLALEQFNCEYDEEGYCQKVYDRIVEQLEAQGVELEDEHGWTQRIRKGEETYPPRK